jgi:hypothetical protein
MLGLESKGCKYPSWFKVVISLLIMVARESATASVFLDRLSVGFIFIVLALDMFCFRFRALFVCSLFINWPERGGRRVETPCI